MTDVLIGAATEVAVILILALVGMLLSLLVSLVHRARRDIADWVALRVNQRYSELVEELLSEAILAAQDMLENYLLSNGDDALVFAMNHVQQRAARYGIQIPNLESRVRASYQKHKGFLIPLPCTNCPAAGCPNCPVPAGGEGEG